MRIQLLWVAVVADGMHLDPSYMSCNHQFSRPSHLEVLLVGFSSSPVQPDDKMDAKFLNFFDSIRKKDAKRSETYRGILGLETLREEQAFDALKEELQFTRQRNAQKDKNNVGEKFAAFKREIPVYNVDDAPDLTHIGRDLALPPRPPPQSENHEEICHALITLHLSTFVNRISHIIREQVEYIDGSVYCNLFNRVLSGAGMTPAPSAFLPEDSSLVTARTNQTFFIFRFQVNGTVDAALADIDEHRNRFHLEDKRVLGVGINYRYVETQHKTRDWLICSWGANLYSKTGALLKAYPQRELVHPEPMRIRLHSVSNDYEILDKIGTGCSSTVRRCLEKKTGRIYAAKIISFDLSVESDLRADARREIDVMNQLHHQNLLQMYAAYEETERMVLVVELLTGVQLNMLGKMSEIEAVYYVKQICQGVKYMHERNIFHFNIGPENVMCCTKMCTDVKLIDFGLSMKYDAFVLHQQNSSLGVLEEVFFDSSGPYSDMRDIGILTHFLLTRTKLNPENVEKGIYIDREDPDFKKISDDGRNFIDRLLELDIRQRMTVHQSLNHPWLNQNLEGVEGLLQS